MELKVTIARTGMLIATAMSCALFGTGCKSNTTKKVPGPYETIGKDIRRDTETARAENTKAVELITAGKYQEAEAILRRALEADVTFGPAHNNLGKVYFHRGEMYLAAWEFQYAANLMRDQPEPRNNLGLVFESVGKFDDAVTWYDAALREGPDNPQYLGNAARARIARGDRDAVVRELLEKLVMRDTRTDWVEWARESLATMDIAPTAPTTTSATQ